MDHLKRAAQAVVESLHDAQAGLSAGWDAACAPGCPVCCTDRVIMTWVEADILAQGLERAGCGELLARVRGRPAMAGARPAASMNAWALRCLEKEPPAAESAPAAPGGDCPLLAGGCCAAYESRPMACRVMYSSQTCRPGGEARAEPYWLTLGSALMQLVEAASLGGGVGLMAEMLAGGPGEPCQPLPGLVAPPQHQARLTAALGTVCARPVMGRPLGHWFDEVRRRVG